MSAYAGPNARLSDREFRERYEAHALARFSHEDHLRMAFAYARRDGVACAVRGARRIQELADAAGAPGKYHDTITVAWARIVAHHALESDAASFEEFLETHPQLRRRDLLSAHYSPELLFSPAARATFIESNLAPLP